jgi:1,2-beta-oligoglucan phosphorylase
MAQRILCVSASLRQKYNKMKINNSFGLSFEFLENGSVQSIEASPIRINLKAATPFSKPGMNLFLRKRGKSIEYKALTGPESDSRFKIENNRYVALGSWAGLDYTCTLRLSGKSRSWQWGVELQNNSEDILDLDLVYLQDVGLKPINAGLLNEYYVSQYLERRIIEDQKYGAVACCRQNMKESTGYPWLMIACMNGAASACTDGMMFYGKTYRETGIPVGLTTDKPGGEYAGESPVFALQENPFILAPGELHRSIFVATYLPDHMQATTGEDLKRLPLLMGEFDHEMESRSKETPSHLKETPSQNLFTTSHLLLAEDLNNDELNSFFGGERRHCEEENGRLLSFFNKENNHIVLKAKELMADRPHAHIMQAKAGFAPDENILATTSLAFGVFNSHISQGNTNFNVLLSICTSQFNQTLESGQRIFIEIEGRYYLLGVPSAFEMGLNHCRWIYKHRGHCFQVRTWTSKTAPLVNLDFKVVTGSPVNLTITHDFDGLNGWKIKPGDTGSEFLAIPETGSMINTKFPDARYRIAVQNSGIGFKAGGDELLYNDNKKHGSSLFVLNIDKTAEFCMSFIGEVCAFTGKIKIEDPDNQFLSDCRDGRSAWHDLSLNLKLIGDQKDIAAIREILPWYGMNALTHFLTPYGPEQFSGAAWGTRDVSQGPVDLLLTMEKYDEARQVLCTIFSNQDPNGGWPQWWMFDSYQEIRADSAHGDIYYWTLIALASYIKVTGDLKILGEVLPYYHKHGTAHVEKTSLSEHVDRLIRMIVDSFIPGTALVPFDGGDWNDSLQPVSKELAQRMISSWTVEMNFQAFDQYRVVYEMTGNKQKAKELYNTCEKIRADFNKYLVKDGIVAGYGLVEPDGSIGVLLHPTDTQTGIHYSILPMERGILSGIFTKEQAYHHMELIENHLKGPDGARLMDRPLKYKGGIQEIFQRAESSTFFGREIGLMYVHEHIRYAESLARMGKADAFVKALRQAIPVGYRDVVPCGDIRQSNCYYSSSDVAFKNRYEADELYDEIKTGKITLRGGWRVYSSGPGIYIGLVVSKLLGLRIEWGNVIIDPVMPFLFDGFTVMMDFIGFLVTFRYSVKEANFSPKSVSINGKVIKFPSVENKYRNGGAGIPINQFLEILRHGENFVEVRI